MHPLAHDLTGMKFGRLSVVRYEGKHGNRHTKWLCLRQCGSDKVVLGCNLKKGSTLSCGCYGRERHTKHGFRPADNRESAPEYSVWQGIKQRCNNPRAGAYPNYGGRGIRICDRWSSDFSSFIADVGRRPAADLTLERIDNDGHYEPGNVKWATRLEQRANQRKCQRLELFSTEELLEELRRRARSLNH
jgi:hypothetical protein